MATPPCGRASRAKPYLPSGASSWRELPVLLIDLPGATVLDQVHNEIDDVGSLRPANYRLIRELGRLEPHGHLGANLRGRTGDLDVLESQCAYAADTPAGASFAPLAESELMLGNFAGEKGPNVVRRQIRLAVRVQLGG